MSRLSEAARDIVRQRDGHRCQMCGASIVDIPSSIHHRVPKGMGGSKLLDIPENLIRLCGTGTSGCHGWVESNRQVAYALGWLISRFQGRPAEVPVKTYHGWVYLTSEGEYLSAEPPDLEVS